MTGKPAAIAYKDLLQYSLLAMPIAFAGMPLYVHAPDYYATQFNLSLSSIGFILLFLRLVDAVQDPLIGRLGDRFSKKRPLIFIIASIVLFLAFTGLFQPITEQSILFWFALMMLLATTASSTLSINLNALGGLWSKDIHQKTRITTTREAFGLIGLLLAVLLPSIFMQAMPKAESFGWISIILLLLTCVGMIFFLRWHKKHPAPDAPRLSGAQNSILKVLRTMPQSMRAFFTVYGISMLASTIPAILVLFFIRDRLDAENYTGLFLLLYFLSGAAGMPLWNYLSSRWNKHHAWMTAMLLAVAIFFWATFLEEGDVWQYAVICIFSGLAFGADLALPPSILADHIHAQQQERHASLQFGVFAFLAKSALAIASAIVLPLLDWSGLRAGDINTSEALFALSITYAAIPCAIKLIAAGMLWRIRPIQPGESHDQEINPSINRIHHHA